MNIKKFIDKFIKILKNKWIIRFRKIILHPLVWILFPMFGSALISPVVLVHYSDKAKESINIELNYETGSVSSPFKPGEMRTYYFDVFQNKNDWFVVSVYEDKVTDWVKVDPPYSRVDVYVNEDKSLGRVEKKTAFIYRLSWLRFW